MSFVYPNFLWAYTLIIIPIIIHLFNFRRYKTVYFSRVASLKEVNQDSKTGNQLKHLLVLLSRILAIVCLVTAFAQPFIPLNEGEKTENITSIYIDNSFSMQAKGQDGDLLNECKNKAIELIKSLETNERVNILTTDLLGIHQRFYSKSEAIDLIKEIKFSPLSTSLESVLSTQVDLLQSANENTNERIFLFSDFQESTHRLNDWKRPPVYTSFYLAKTEINENIYIDSVWFDSPVHRVNQPSLLKFKIVNQSDKDQNDLSVSLSINEKKQGPKRVSIKANSFTIDQIEFTDQSAGIKQGKLEIVTNQLFFDDEFYFVYETKEDVKLLIVSERENQSSNLSQLFQVDDYYMADEKSIQDVSSEDFKNKELVIYNNVNNIPTGIQELNDNILKDGGSIVFIPGENADLDSWNNQMGRLNLPLLTNKDSVNSSLDYFNYDDPLYEGVFEKDPTDYKYPEVYAAYPLSSFSNLNYITLFGIGSQQKRPFLLYQEASNGKIYLMNSPLNPRYTNFQNHALFAATFLRIAETATFKKPLYGTLGNIPNFPIYNEIDEQSPIHLLNTEKEVDVIPLLLNNNKNRVVSFSHLENEITSSGFYALDNSQDFHEMLGLNFNRQESDITALQEEDIVNQFKAVGWEINSIKGSDSSSLELNSIKAKEYWRILLILGLVFIAIEIALLKFWKS